MVFYNRLRFLKYFYMREMRFFNFQLKLKYKYN